MRRRRSAVLLLAVTAIAGCGATPPDPPRPAASTRQATLQDPDGDGRLDREPGEALVDRTDLAPRSRTTATVATFAQLSDLHVRDEESPTRVPFLDRYGQPFFPAFRPQEALSAPVVAAAVRAMNRQRPQATFVTGDLTDNDQANELDWVLRLLDGGTITPDSGGPGYRGVQQASDPDPFYYRPDVDPPRHPGLLAQAQRPVMSPGLTAPWYGVLGNHDVLLQGEAPPDARTDEIATGTRLVTSLEPGTRLPESATTAQAVDAVLDAAGRSLRVPADPRRRSVSPAATVARLARGRALREPDRLDYTVDVGGAMAVVLDVVNRAGGQEAVTDDAQLAWLDAQLRGTARPVVVVSHAPLPDAVLAVLDGHRNVVLAIHGDTHSNRIEPRGHFWVVGTSSLADWPMQGRMLELRRTAAGGYAIDTWMVDQDGRGLAGPARQLAFLDSQGGRPRGFAGRRIDRNARLFTPPA